VLVYVQHWPVEFTELELLVRVAFALLDGLELVTPLPNVWLKHVVVPASDMLLDGVGVGVGVLIAQNQQSVVVPASGALVDEVALGKLVDVVEVVDRNGRHCE
jgi:hypothetical protein